MNLRVFSCFQKVMIFEEASERCQMKMDLMIGKNKSDSKSLMYEEESIVGPAFGGS